MPFINTKVLRLCKAFANDSLANIKLSKSHLHEKWQSQRFLVRLLGPSLKTGLSLTGNALKPLAKIILISSRLTAAALITDASTHKNVSGSGMRCTYLAKQTTLTTSNEEMNDIMNIIKSLEKSGLLIKDASETTKNEAKNKKEDLLEC